ncbi:MAG: rhodanese-related (seleno)protein [Syntrophobacteraceae bacterium]|jgi:rhodanese-related sulfurtransferase
MRRPDLRSFLAACLIVILAASLVGGAEVITAITKDQLKGSLTKPRLVIIDVRTVHDWDASQWKIQGAQRQVASEVKEWMGQYPKDKVIVLYCASPNQATSAGVAQDLTSAGFKNVAILEGGWGEWALSEYPIEKK